MLKEQLSLLRIQDLKQEVKKKLGRSIMASSDCLLLADDIYKKTGIKLSFNTIRRCFDIMKSDHQPSLHTLDTLSKYCGFSSFGSFYSSDKPSSTKEPDIQNKYLLNYIILLFKNIKLSSFNDGTYLQLVGQTIKYLDDHEYLIDPFHKQIAKTTNGQVFYFQYFVHIDRLNSSYGKGLRYYLAEKKTKESRIFGLSLLCFKSWLTSDKKGVDEYYSKLSELSLDLLADPILWSHYFASQVYFYEVNGIDKTSLLIRVRQYYTTLKPTAGTFGCLTCFELVISEALLLTKEFEEALFYITKARAIEVTHEPEYSNLHTTETINLFEARAQAGIGNLYESRELLKKINPENFFFPSKQYYMILYLTLKLSFYEGRSIRKELTSLIGQTGFNRLTEETLVSH